MDFKECFKEIPNIQFKKLIGRGGFSIVCLVYRVNDGEHYAAKIVDNSCSNDIKRYFYNEIAILKSLKHDNIVKYIDNIGTSKYNILLMEYCCGQSLLKCLQRYIMKYNKPFSEVTVQYIMRQIVKGLEYIHQNNIIHRDLKTENIFVKFYKVEEYNDLNMMKTHIKIGDFGFSAKADTFRTLVGTYNYMDPIILKKIKERTDYKNFDKTCDIWSLGSICFEMIIGKKVFNGKNMAQIYENVEKGNYSLPLSLSKEIVSFINGMLQYDPQKRLTIEKLATHPFLTKDVKDFSKIHLSQLQSRIVDGELKINTKMNESIWSIFNDDENFLRSISSTFFDEFPHHIQPNKNIPVFRGNAGMGNIHLQNNYEEKKTNNYNGINPIPGTNIINNIHSNNNKLSKNHTNNINEKNKLHAQNNNQILKNNNFNNRINNNNFYNQNINNIPKTNIINYMHNNINSNINNNNRDNNIYNNMNNNGKNMVNNNFYNNINNNLNNNTNNINSNIHIQQNMNRAPHFVGNINKNELENKNLNNNLNRDIQNNINSIYNFINNKENNNFYKKIFDSQKSNKNNNLVNKNSNNINQVGSAMIHNSQCTINSNLYQNNIPNNNNNSNLYGYNRVDSNIQALSKSTSVGTSLAPGNSKIGSINQFNDKFY